MIPLKPEFSRPLAGGQLWQRADDSVLCASVCVQIAPGQIQFPLWERQNAL